MCFWCEINTNNQPKMETFHVIGTGHSIPENSTHIGSFVNDPFVWHLYQENKA
jgi:hypothetical protein